MEKIYEDAKVAYDNKDFVKALELFSQINYLDSKKYENICVDNLEDIIYYSKRKVSLEYLEKLKFYEYYSYFIDTYKRKKMDFICKIIIVVCVVISTLILLVFGIN